MPEQPRLPTDKQRAQRYREQAEHFRELAEAEPVGGIRQQLANLADQYQELAERLLQSNRPFRDPHHAGQ